MVLDLVKKRRKERCICQDEYIDYINNDGIGNE